MTAKSRLHLAPRECHREIMDRLQPSLRFTGGDVRQWQRRLRARLRVLLGELPAGRAALKPRRLWLRKHPLGTIEKVVFTSEPHCDVPAYVCLPASARPPYTFMICLQGHSTGMHNSIAVKYGAETRPIKVVGDRDFGLECMRRGVAALCIEQRGFGERRDAMPPVGGQQPKTACRDVTLHALQLGRTLIGERVYDVDRAIDYLERRGDADMRRVGVMGNSGGGTTSVFAAAMLPRIAFAMPSCYFCTFRDSIMSIRHCLCNYVPGLLRYAEMADVMGLFAPRPLVIVAGRQDPIFPFPAVQKAFRDLRRIYRAAGADRRCHLVAGAEGHRFYAREAWPVMLKEMAR